MNSCEHICTNQYRKTKGRIEKKGRGRRGE